MDKYICKLNKKNLKSIRSLALEIEDEKARQNNLVFSLFGHNSSAIIERNQKFLDDIYKQIEDIPDCLVRRAIKLRYIDGKSWTQVGVHMGYNSPDSARVMLDRYFDGLNK